MYGMMNPPQYMMYPFNNPMNMYNFNNFMMPGMVYEPWAESYEQKDSFYMNNSQKQNSSEPNKINIVFKTTAKVKTNIVADHGQTMSEVLLLYLKKEGKEKLFKRCSGIFFLFNAQIIDIYDETKVEEFFKNESNPLIIVNEMNFVIGA